MLRSFFVAGLTSGSGIQLALQDFQGEVLWLVTLVLFQVGFIWLRAVE